MRTPPSPTQLPSYPVAGGIGLMATAVTAMTLTNRWPIDRFTMGPTAFTTEPWRLVTCMLPHGDPLHLIFNVYWLWVFGTLLEEVLGHARLLAVVVLFQAGSMAADYALSHGGIGLSGVGYGLFGLLWALTPRDRRFAGAVDARTTQLFVVWFLFCIVATQMKVMAIANVAHGAGAILGALLGLSMSARERASRLVAGFAIPTLIGASFVGATALRPRINLAHDGHGSFQLGYQALQEGRPADAVKSYRETVATDPSDPRAWHNLGVAYAQVGDAEQATAAFRRSFELDGSRDRRRTYVEHALRIGQESLQRADTARAEAIGLEILRVEPDERRAQELLVGVYHQTGRTAEEQRMMNRIASHGADAGAL